MLITPSAVFAIALPPVSSMNWSIWLAAVNGTLRFEIAVLASKSLGITAPATVWPSLVVKWISFPCWSLPIPANTFPVISHRSSFMRFWASSKPSMIGLPDIERPLMLENMAVWFSLLDSVLTNWENGMDIGLGDPVVATLRDHDPGEAGFLAFFGSLETLNTTP